MEITVSEKIRLIMTRKKMTIGDVAARTGQTRQNLSNKLARGNFTEKDIREIAKAMDCTADVIFTMQDGTEI